MKKLLCTLVCLILVFVSCAALAEPVVMKFAGTTTADPELGEYQAMLKFEELVEEYSNGEIDVEVYPASQLGGSVEFTEGTALGTVEACVVGFDGIGNLAPECYAICMPYLYDNIEQMRPILEGDTEARKAIDTVLSGTNLKLVALLYRPMRVMANTKHAVKSPADMAGLQVRSPSSEANTAIITAMGGLPTTIAWSEVFTALQSNACDGVENAITELASINLQEVVKYVSETNHMPSPIALVVGEAWFNGLTEEQQAAIVKAGVDVTEWRAENVAQEIDAAWKKFEDAGVEVLYADDIDFQAFKDACAEVYKEFVGKGYFTEEFFESLKG
ncbi:MAG: TRAP transporter substrate-binding protein [Clostridia bacterium]|nr:TRAP transporter substrate-binding protein [Clostridia bacterium]